MSCSGCLSQPARITNIFRDDDLLAKFSDLTGINVDCNTFMCDSCIDLLDIAAGFKERCLEIFQKSFPHNEDAHELQDDDLVLFETEEYIDEPMEVLHYTAVGEVETVADQLHESALDENEDVTLFDLIKPELNHPVAPTGEPASNQKVQRSPRLKKERKGSSVDKSIQSNGDQTKGSKSRMSYTSSKKLEAIKYAELVGNRQAAKVFLIDESCVRKWRSKKTELLEINSERCTKRKPNLHWPELDKTLRLWVNEQLEQGFDLKPSMIKAKSIELATSLKLVDFKGSSSYVFKFMQRYRIPGSRGSQQAPND